MLADFAVVDLDPEVVARLDPGGPDGGPPEWWMAQWCQEFEEAGPQPEPAAEPEPAVDEGTARRLEAYAAHRELGRSPAEAAWEAELEMEAS